jgi:hypothetical protein
VADGFLADDEVDGWAVGFDDGAVGDFVDDFDFADDPESDVLPDDDCADFVLDFSAEPVTDLTVFSAADVTFLTGLPSACATPVANPSRRNPTISPTTRSSRRAARTSTRFRGSVAAPAGVGDAVVVMAMRSPPWSPATDGCCPARNVMRGRRGRST